jgi:transcriptional regulator with XRE-family HTH domain
MPARDTVPAAGSGKDAAAMEALGRRLHEMRRTRGMTQASVAEALNCDQSAVSRIERGTYPLTPQMFRSVERLLSFAAAGGYEPWFISYLDIESRATVIRSWQPLVVDGLLQTEAYARAMIRAGRPGDSDAEINQLVTARMARQRIWERADPPPPMLFVVLGEAVLRQRVGDAAVMHGQLSRLAEAAASPRITVQVMPFASAAHPGLLGPFVVASFETGPDAAYLDNALNGQVTERRPEVSRVGLLYDILRSEALSQGASAEMIARMMREWT